ncbi:MAG: TlpA family protein disulfide reductase [Candidatus Rokubacteria bacterium]|nr:TlpA family protein disulfide reductase [Chloroflexota bacterium]MBM4443375.1 TlpA family protein disulfide reductase [Candidatus Rokubacteria bacterium]
MPRSPVSRLAAICAGVAAIALVAALAIAMQRGVGSSPLGRTDAGFAVAHDFTLPTLDGGEFALADHASGPLLLYFWASWCRPCEEEAPVIERLWPEYRALGYTFVGINILDAERDARDFVARHRLTFPLLRDVEGTVYLDYGVYGLPEAFFIRAGLRVSEKYNGALSEGELRAMLARLQEGS